MVNTQSLITGILPTSSGLTLSTEAAIGGKNKPLLRLTLATVPPEIISGIITNR